MRLYAELARRSFRRFATYRGATVAGVFTNTVFGFILASVLRAALAARSVGGLDADTATAFTFVGQGLLMVMLVFGDYEGADRVRTGEIAVELVRPVDYSTWRLAQDLGRSGYYALARGLPPFAAGWIAFRFPVPGPSRLALFGLTVVGGAIVSSRVWLLATTASFWLTDGRGLVQLTSIVATISTGSLVPLQFYPDGLREVLRASPWAAMLQLPIEFYLGVVELPRVLALQLVWLAIVELLVRLELSAALRKLVVHGG